VSQGRSDGRRQKRFCYPAPESVQFKVRSRPMYTGFVFLMGHARINQVKRPLRAHPEAFTIPTVPSDDGLFSGLHDLICRLLTTSSGDTSIVMCASMPPSLRPTAEECQKRTAVLMEMT